MACRVRPADGGPGLGFADLDQLAAYLLRLAEADGTGQERGPPRAPSSPFHPQFECLVESDRGAV